MFNTTNTIIVAPIPTRPGCVIARAAGRWAAPRRATAWRRVAATQQTAPAHEAAP